MIDKYRVLIVDDEPDNLALLYRTLRGKYEIEKSTSPITALEMIKQKKFHCILSDHKMPEMDGVEFLKRCSESSPDTMRLLVTAFSDAGILIDAINYAKIYRYIKKPYNPDELLLIVQNALDYYQLKVDNKSLIKDLKELFAGTVTAIVEALDAKDSYTLGRSRRVTYYAVKIARALHLSENTTGKIELAGLLHDIGMIGVSDDILTKVEKLTTDEYNEIKKHVQHSVKILDDIKQLNEVVEIIKYHHERYDGTGYPIGLQKDEIPVSSYIISISDMYEKLTSDSAMKKAVSHEEAMQIINDQSGKKYPPEIVAAFTTAMNNAKDEYQRFIKEE